MSGGTITKKRLNDPYTRSVLMTLDDLIYSQSGKRDEQIRRYARKNASPTMRTVLRACHDYDIALAAECTGEQHLLTSAESIKGFAYRARSRMITAATGTKSTELAEIGLTRGIVDGWTRTDFTWPRIGDLVKLGTRTGYRFSWYTKNNKYEV